MLCPLVFIWQGTSKLHESSVSKSDEQEHRLLSHWQYFFKTGEVTENAPDYIKAAKKRIDFYQLDEEEKKMIMRIDKAKAIKKAEIDYARKEGKLEGKLEGKTEGKMEEKLEVAANCLKLDIAPEQIVQITGLSIERINELKENKAD